MRPAVSGKGFPDTTKGSHVFYRHPDGRTTTIPHHPGRDLDRPLIREILREVEISPEQFASMLQET
ncbi:MAG: type II toxin-antitoxin system HicA family toxin [Armatimonadota bacterium]|nr:type II toxin-antitoxin system HicA family toxin [bacterium]